MHLPRSAEQEMLADSAARFLRETAAPAWQDMAALGWIAAAFDEDCGGLSGSAADIAALSEAIGASGACLPYFSGVLLPAMVIRRLPAAHDRRALAAALMEGAGPMAVAHQEGGTAFDARAPVAMQADGAGRLTGTKRRVWNAGAADTMIASATGPEGFGLYLVAPGAPGCAVVGNGDATLASATVSFAASPARLLVGGEAARTVLDDASAFALIGVLAETLGLMTLAFGAARAWLGTRTQFGRPLAANQVLRHRLADMFIALEESRSMLNLAIHVHDHADSPGRAAALHAARAHIGRAARMVGQSAVHLHGAMGITAELPAGRAYRRIEALGAVFGNADVHLRHLATLREATP